MRALDGAFQFQQEAERSNHKDIENAKEIRKDLHPGQYRDHLFTAHSPTPDVSRRIARRAAGLKPEHDIHARISWRRNQDRLLRGSWDKNWPIPAGSFIGFKRVHGKKAYRKPVVHCGVRERQAKGLIASMQKNRHARVSIPNHHEP